MMEISLTFAGGACRTLTCAAPAAIGRDVRCAVRISHWRVGRQHARLLEKEGSIALEDLGTLAGTLVNGARTTRHEPVLPGDEIIIGPCAIRVRHSETTASPPQELARTPSAQHTAPLLSNLSQERLIHDEATLHPGVDLIAHRQRLHTALLEALDLRRRDVAKMSDSLLRSEAERLLMEIVKSDTTLPAYVDREALCRELLDEAVGLGPLEPLLADPNISEIMVNRHDEIYVERKGCLARHTAAFSSEQSVRWAIDRIVAPLGRRIDESTPMVDARLLDGSRVNAVIHPVALKGASLTIRKFPARRPDIAHLLSAGSLDEAMAHFLLTCVRARKNLVVSGGTGSGKTTLLNVLSNGIPTAERGITIEDAAELRLNHAHLVALEARPPNLENRGRIDIRDLVRNALRMRPDRIIVGECRGAEAFDMLAAMNTGHEGSLTTLHANSPRDALARLESMILMAGMDLPLSVVREHIAAAVDILVQQSRLADGRRLVSAIVEITGMESGRIQTQELFRYERTGHFVGCGVMPTFVETGDESSRILEPNLFNRRTPASPRGNADPHATELSANL
jgi:pilus assembly protein CpaF